MWLSHLDSVYKENESKVKLPLSVICTRGSTGRAADLSIKLSEKKEYGIRFKEKR
jgi:hypothetical protein